MIVMCHTPESIQQHILFCEKKWNTGFRNYVIKKVFGPDFWRVHCDGLDFWIFWPELGFSHPT